MSEVSIMEPIGEETGQIILTDDSVFTNSKCLFIEYLDIIRAPYFVGMWKYKDHVDMNQIIDLSETKDWDEHEWLEWYFSREKINPLQCFRKLTEDVTDDKLDIVLNNWLSDDEIVLADGNLPFLYSVLILLNTSNLAEDIVMYTKDYSKYIETDINKTFGGKVHYVYGELKDVLTIIPKDSTYIFSDVMHINTLIETNRLNLSSVIIAEDYQYNFKKDGMLKINIEELNDQYTFHCGMLSNNPHNMLDDENEFLS